MRPLLCELQPPAAYPQRDESWTRVEPVTRTIEALGTSASARDAFNAFMTANSSLTGPDAEPMAIPFAGGLPNLSKFAFHTDFSAIGVQGYEPSRASRGLPTITVNLESKETTSDASGAVVIIDRPLPL